jgi:serine hydrolase
MLQFAGIVVVSTDDPYGRVAFASRCAVAWGGEIAVAGALGHINATSGLGEWPDVYALLTELIGT